ncbi:Scr1 family TA system antitoxin-like transcriptional regulator [Streptomyces brevispora]|uniref:Scr1 family TA system antitoxin-like transcriptional regulator n=1 Tax=Streptomyces brevispora TaxID=887462 RepID=UPI00371398C6
MVTLPHPRHGGIDHPRAPSAPFGADNSGQARRPETTPPSTAPAKHAGQSHYSRSRTVDSQAQSACSILVTRSMICPPSVLAAQLDRLMGVVGMDTVELGIIPFTASVKIVPANGFWVLDDRLIVAEDRHAEMWLDDTDNITLYTKVWKTLRESAVYGADAHNIINSARRTLNPR